MTKTRLNSHSAVIDQMGVLINSTQLLVLVHKSSFFSPLHPATSGFWELEDRRTLERRGHEIGDNVSFNFMKRLHHLSLLKKHGLPSANRAGTARRGWGRRQSGCYKASRTSATLVLLASCWHLSLVLLSLSQRMENKPSQSDGSVVSLKPLSPSTWAICRLQTAKEWGACAYLCRAF